MAERREWKRVSGFRSGFLLVALLQALLPAAVADAAVVRVKGQLLEGKVVGVTPKGVKFETVLGEGAIVIPYADVDELSSDRSFVVLYGESGEVRGRLVGVDGGQLLVGDDPATATPVEAGSIFRSFTVEEFDASGIEALRARYRFWHADFALSFAATQATTDTSNFAIDFDVSRRKGPNRLIFNSGFRLATQQKKDEAESTLENSIRGLLRGEHDFSERIFVFGSATAEYDEIQSLSFRSVPKGGLGYRIWKTEKAELSVDLGASFVYQRFFGGREESYPAVSFGGDFRADLPRGSTLTARGEYLPSVNLWRQNYLLRGSAVLSIPMLHWLAFRFTLFDEYNNQPAVGTDNNTFTVTAGLSLTF
jgi:putative salt-induced outer membrane protein YdiY